MSFFTQASILLNKMKELQGGESMVHIHNYADIQKARLIKNVETTELYGRAAHVHAAPSLAP